MTICSISTAPGIGAIAVIRVSGEKAFPIVNQLFNAQIDFLGTSANRAKFAEIFDGDTLVDQVVFVKFAAPHSYDGEDMVEISCHGSRYIQQKILQMLLARGCRLAEPGEFTMRAFLNGKMDLPQAEAVSDLIDSQSETAHRLAVNQLKGGFSHKIAELREQFIHLAALLELELDFSEEDVQFADRKQIMDLLRHLKKEITRLTDSFKLGNALKSGIPVAIVGKPNVGKSTLLNALLGDDRAIVSDIPGTTRDTVEDTFTYHGTTFRFIDTAGIRTSEDEIENFGIERTFKAVENADIVLYLIDINATTIDDVEAEMTFIRQKINLEEKKILLVANKIDEMETLPRQFSEWDKLETVFVSAKRKVNLESIGEMLLRYVEERNVSENTLLTNARHYDIMRQILQDIENIEQGFENQQPTDLIAVDVHLILDKLGRLTGSISDNDVLNTIFSRFCIGK
ncbi:MAG: tRNA uridine-5-carboxymethylaminomethyl(34) synthesis GTPase MnmE [Bacteroidales bacterium]|nr:tRNA uridine-5-carboxymethylaminomethyl(34) synthesis GTPase MnmE [Bacteroidales bacterium]